MTWFTAKQLAETLGGDTMRETGFQAITDAGRILGHIASQPGISDHDLRVWGERAGIKPERYNAAVAIIVRRKLAANLQAPFVDDPAAPSDEVAIPHRHLTKEELRAVADRLDLDVPKSATKADLAQAIAGAP